MAWIEGLATISGPRWSAGGTWGESDWANGATWDAAHTYAADTDVSLGVYLHGRDVTEDVIGASWQLGQTALLPTSLRPSSCTIELRSTAGGFALDGFDPTGFEPVSVDVAIGRRVVILTEWDVLWVGRVEASAVTYDAAQSARAGGPRYTLRLSAVDDLARAALLPQAQTLRSPYYMVQVMRELLAEAGIPAPVLGTPAITSVSTSDTNTYAGTALDTLAQLTWQSASIGAYTPSGYLVAPLLLVWGDDLPAPVDDYDDMHTRTIGYSLSDVKTRLVVRDETDTFTYDYAESQVAYGVRELDVDTSAWWDASVVRAAWDAYCIDGDIPYHEPVARLSASARIGAQRHKVARLLPLSQLSDDDADGADATEWWRVLQVQHRLTVDAWDVSIEAVAITGPT